MLSFFDSFRDINTVNILFRMVFAVICGGVIGIERSIKNRPAGFRTHILIITGATAASLTGHYIYMILGLPTDMSRLGAGTIIVTGTRTVKGLTTAAGLWATGIMGLAIGAGFYEGALIGTIAILFTEIVLGKIKVKRVKGFRCVVNYLNKESLDHVLRFCKDRGIAIKALSIESARDESGANVYSAFVTLQPTTEIEHREFVHRVEAIDGVLSVVIN